MPKLYGTTFPGLNGDTTYVWTDASDSAITERIKELLNQKYTFFIITPRLNGLVAPDQVKLTKRNLVDITKSRALSGPDNLFTDLIEAGTITAIVTPNSELVGTKKATTAEEVVSNETVAVKPASGG
jgi:hypothetical protein